MNRLPPGQLWIAILLGWLLSAGGAAALDAPETTDLERAFGKAFSRVPTIARLDNGACQHHARQASRIAQLRDLQLGKDQAIALLNSVEKVQPTQEDRNLAAALSIIHLAVVDFVYGPGRPPDAVAAAAVNGACVLEVGRVIGTTRV